MHPAVIVKRSNVIQQLLHCLIAEQTILNQVQKTAAPRDTLRVNFPPYLEPDGPLQNLSDL